MQSVMLLEGPGEPETGSEGWGRRARRLARAILARKAVVLAARDLFERDGRHLLETGQLRDGIDLGEVRDVLWNYLAIDHYERLVLSQAGRSSGTRAGWPRPSPAPCARASWRPRYRRRRG